MRHVSAASASGGLGIDPSGMAGGACSSAHPGGDGAWPPRPRYWVHSRGGWRGPKQHCAHTRSMRGCLCPLGHLSQPQDLACHAHAPASRRTHERICAGVLERQ
eukprot:scaffold1825_cov112-Isochrysis_galbana.AAC.3